MRKLLLSATFAFTLLATTNTFAQQGFGTNQPDKSAAVDIVSSKRGLLIPRVALTATDSNSLSVGEITAPANSLFVYNTATAGTGATAVTPGFYYWERTDTIDKDAWQGKWVRFVSTNQEKSVVVDAGENVKVEPTIIGNSTTYTVGVKGGSKTGQVLVTKVTGAGATAVTTTEWVNPESFVQDAIFAENGLTYVPSTVEGDPNIIKLGGALTENTTITTVSGATDPGDNKSLAITGLEVVDTAAHIMVMDANGFLQKMTKEKFIDAKDMTSTDGIITLNGVESVDNSVLVGVELGVANRSIAPSKFKAETADEGKVPVVKNDGTVAWTTIPGTSAATLTTDSKIVIGNSASNINTLTNAVLVATELSIATNSITSTDIKDGTIQVGDIKAPGTATDSSTGGTINQVLVTNADGDVSWVNQSALANKDNYNFTAPLVKSVGIDNTVGGKDYGVTIEGAALTSASMTIPANTALLEALNIEIKPGTVAGQVLTTKNTGTADDPTWTTEWGTSNSSVVVNNGLSKDTTTDAIQLGGDLIKATKITTTDTHTLAVAGLQDAAKKVANKTVVVEPTGILRTVENVVVVTDVKIVDNTNYSVNIPEVLINVTLEGADQTIEFPSAADAKGQTINIKIANTGDTHTGYLNVLNTYGSMPYQGWIVKSNGTAWVIVGRN